MMRLVRFALVGVGGLVVDTAVLYLAAHLGTGWYIGRLISYFVAATFTWYCNRSFTFAVPRPPSVREWATFLVANSVGGMINYGVFAALMATVPLVHAYPVLGVSAGAVAGLFANFLLSMRVFKVTHHAS